MQCFPARTNTTGIVFGLLAVVVAYAQERESCPIAGVNNGEMVRLNAEAVHGAHDGLLRVAGCADQLLFEYADHPSLRESKLTVTKDEVFREFTKYFKAEQPAQPNIVCFGCWKYRVTAVFEGRLDIVPFAGLKRDPDSGKVIGIEGFGHPLPFTRYRLVVTKISKVEVFKRPATSDR